MTVVVTQKSITSVNPPSHHLSPGLNKSENERAYLTRLYRVNGSLYNDGMK